MKDKISYVYMITNLLNNKIYIGVHTWHNINNGYFGSGRDIKKDISLLGKDKFKKEILAIFDNMKDAYDLEQFLVDYDFINCNATYNTSLGGQRHFKGWHHTADAKLRIGEASKCRVKSDATRLLLSKARKGKKFDDDWRTNMSLAAKNVKHKPCSEETKLKISLGNTGKTRTEEYKMQQSLSKKGIPNTKNKGTKRSEETKQKMRQAKLGKKWTAVQRENIMKARSKEDE